MPDNNGQEDHHKQLVCIYTYACPFLLTFARQQTPQSNSIISLPTYFHIYTHTRVPLQEDNDQEEDHKYDCSQELPAKMLACISWGFDDAHKGHAWHKACEIRIDSVECRLRISTRPVQSALLALYVYVGAGRMSVPQWEMHMAYVWRFLIQSYRGLRLRA
jgi:hypothetical protein